ncbi:hypothetical protein STEG23_023663, partial [Scotinomys teguina]
KPLPQGGPGSTARLLGGALAMVLILAMTLAVFLLYRWQQKGRLGIDMDGMDLSPSQKLKPPPDRQSQLGPEDIQGLHLELGRQQEEDLPLQPPYYDLGMSPIYRPLFKVLSMSEFHTLECCFLSTTELTPTAEAGRHLLESVLCRLHNIVPTPILNSNVSTSISPPQRLHNIIPTPILSSNTSTVHICCPITSVGVHVSAGTHGGQKRESDILELK